MKMLRPLDGKINERIGENKVFELLKLDNYFQGILDSDEILDLLYVEYKGKDGPIIDFEPVLHKAYPKVLETKGIHTADGTVEIKLEEIEEDRDCAYLAEFISRAFKRDKDNRGKLMQIRRTRASKRLLVILGGIGEGKTTLLDYFSRRFAKKNRSLENIVRVNVDFEGMENVKPDQFTSDYLTELILREMNREFPELRQDKNKLLSVLEEPLSFQKGLLEVIEDRAGINARDKEELELIKRFAETDRILLASLINYLVNVRGKKVVVTLDNVDRLRSVDCQYKAVTLVHKALHSWDCCAVVCVREYTYGNLWLMGQWGFQRPLLYHKRPPRFAYVLQRHFKQFPVEKYTEKPSFQIREKNVEIEDVKRFVANIANFLWTKGMERTLFRLNNGDIRQMLEMVRAFLSFNSLDLEPIFTATFLKKREEATKIKGLTINFDNFIRAITVGNYQYYCMSSLLLPAARETFVLNMVGGPQTAPLLPYRVLTYFRRFEIVNKDPLIEKATCMGVKAQDVEDVLEAFLKSYLVESMQGVDIQDVKEVVITRKGVYYFDMLSVLAVYIENVMNDAWWDKRIAPYEQSYTLRKEGIFLKESMENIFRAEIRETKGVSKKFRAAYEEFLGEQPYCERIGESIVAYLKGLASRGTVLPKGELDMFEEQLVEIDKAKKDGR